MKKSKTKKTKRSNNRRNMKYNNRSRGGANNSYNKAEKKAHTFLMGALNEASIGYNELGQTQNLRKRIANNVVRDALIRTDDDIHQAVDDWCDDPVAARRKYGHISQWDTSRVTDMGHLFYRGGVVRDERELGRYNFNDDISAWDVSGVTNMNGMFGGASSFNQDLSDWDVSAVTNMVGMFYNARSFNQDLNAWDVSSVTNMNKMFMLATSLDKRPSWYKVV